MSQHVLLPTKKQRNPNQVTTILDPEIKRKLDEEVAKNGQSASAVLARWTYEYLTPKLSDDAMAVEKLQAELSRKEQAIEQLGEKIRSLEGKLETSLDPLEIFKLKTAIEGLEKDIQYKDEIIKLNGERIRELEGLTGWLRSEYEKKDQQLAQFLLPAARSKWKWKFWKKD